MSKIVLSCIQLSQREKKLASIDKPTIPYCMTKEMFFFSFLAQFCYISIYPSICRLQYMHPDPINPSNATTCDFCQQAFDYRTSLFSPLLLSSLSTAHSGFMSLKMHWVKQKVFLHVCSRLKECVLLREMHRDAHTHRHSARKTFEFVIIYIRVSDTES